MFKAILGAIVGPLMYRVNPLYTGRQALRGFYLQQGVDPIGVPLNATEEIAKHALDLSKFSAHLSNKSVMVEYTETLELYALQVRALLYHPDRHDPFLRDCEKIKAILEKHGVNVPPVY